MLDFIINSYNYTYSSLILVINTDSNMGAEVLGMEDLKENKIKTVKAFAAEFIGTMFLVLVGCGACVNHSPNPVGELVT